MNGVITDFKDWYFTRYNLNAEIAQESGGSRAVFELSDKYQVLEQDMKKQHVVNIAALGKVVRILENLTNFSALT